MPSNPTSAALEAASDETLMGWYADGSASAFDEIFRRYEPRAFSYFLRRTASPERARDLYQQLFLRVHGARHDYEPARPFAPWFFRIAFRLLVDDGRRAYRSLEVPTTEDEWAAPAVAYETVSQREQLSHLLRDLSEEERYVLVAFHREGRGYSEIAAQLGKSATAVRKMASRAIQRVRATSSAGSHGPRGVVASTRVG